MIENKKSCSNERLVDELKIKLKIANSFIYILAILVGVLTAILWH